MSELESHVYEYEDHDRERGAGLRRRSRSEPGGRAQRNAGGAFAAGSPLEQLPAEVGERLGDELIDELLAGARSEEEIVGAGGLLSQLTKRLVERAMVVELTDHLGYERGQSPPDGAGNTRNGTTPKTVHTEHGIGADRHSP
jgi:hypothetical protein